MIHRLTTWLGSLGRLLLSLPRRILEGSIRLFWATVAFIRALPGLIKAAAILIVVTCWNGIKAFAAAIGRFFLRITARPRHLLNKQFERDLSKLPPSKVSVAKRGRTVALFSRQLASMTIGGVPLLQSLDVLGEQADDRGMAFVSNELAKRLGQGYALSKAVSEFPRVFPPVYSHLLKAGEGTGRLIDVIRRLADMLEKEENLIKQVRGALSYPLFVLTLTSVLTLGLFSSVLPGFANFYKDFQVPLPLMTAFLMKLTAWVQSGWFWFFSLLLVGATVAFVHHSWQILERRLVMYSALLWIPLVGPIIRFSALARYCWVMELTQDAGLDVMRSVKLASLASGSPLLEVDSSRILKGITEGEHLSDLMKQNRGFYPHFLQQMVMMGEETSKYSESFSRTGVWFEQDVQGRVEAFQAALEPILMGLISIVVGTIVLAVFLPLYGLLDKLGV